MSVRISAIVPVYNTEKYVRSALDSLLDQTVAFYEIIVIDDGSTDSSFEILREYEVNGRITLIAQPNQGQGYARNNGIKAATGEYLYFFDSDDLASPVLVERIQRELDACADLEFVAFAGDTFFDENYRPLSFELNYGRSVVGRYRSFFEAASAMELLASNHCSPCLYVLKRDVVEAMNLRFHRFFHEDDAFLLDLTASVGPCMVLGDKLFRRRVRAYSTTTSRKTASHVQGYLHASSVAGRYAFEAELPSVKRYFQKKSIQYYLQAMSISYDVGDFERYKNICSRLADLPSWSINWRQFVSLLLGQNAKTVGTWLAKVQQRNNV